MPSDLLPLLIHSLMTIRSSSSHTPFHMHGPIKSGLICGLSYHIKLVAGHMSVVLWKRLQWFTSSEECCCPRCLLGEQLERRMHERGEACKLTSGNFVAVNIHEAVMSHTMHRGQQGYCWLVMHAGLCVAFIAQHTKKRGWPARLTADWHQTRK